MKYFVIGFITFLAGFGVQAGNLDSYTSFQLGERDPGLYYGPFDPEHHYSDSTGKISFEDENYFDNFFKGPIEAEAIDLSHVWLDEFVNKANCPNELLNENVDYIRYLFRLQTISYLLEALKEYQGKISELGGRSYACPLKYTDIFKNCSPKTSDMKKFVERVQFRYDVNLSLQTKDRFNNDEIRDWTAALDTHKNGLDFTQKRIQLYCESHKCGIMTSSRAVDALKDICQEDTRLIQAICSEKDSLMGASYVEQYRQLILTADAFVNVNRYANGHHCLNRFIKMTEVLENKYEQLNVVIPEIFKIVLSRNETYLQGKFFIPGALKEFDNKGLTDFLFIPEPTPVVIAKAGPKPAPKPVVVPKPEPKPEPKAEPIPEPKPEPIPEPEPVVVLSAFEKAREVLAIQKLDKVPVDMIDMKDDFVFSDKLRKTLDGPMKEYQTRRGLKDMKQHDKLGSKQEPLSLIFLKYMIDSNNHQGLYNVQGVIGEQFYLINDIDDKAEPVWTELRMDAGTNYQWQLTLVSDDYKQRVAKETKEKEERIEKAKATREAEEKRRKRVQLIKKLKIQKNLVLPGEDLE